MYLPISFMLFMYTSVVSTSESVIKKSILSLFKWALAFNTKLLNICFVARCAKSGWVCNTTFNVKFDSM